MKANNTAWVIALIAITLFTNSCSHSTSSDTGTYNLKGYLWDSCNGKPLVDIPLQVSYYRKSNGFGGKTIDDGNVGTGKTNGIGYFEIKCKDYKSEGTINLFNAQTNQQYLIKHSVPSYIKDEIVDVSTGYIYGSIFNTKVKIIVSGTFTLGDTLYVGSGKDDYEQFTNLVSGSDYSFTKSFQMPSFTPESRFNNYTLLWGFGKNNYTSKGNPFNAVTYRCNTPDTITVLNVSK